MGIYIADQQLLESSNPTFAGLNSTDDVQITATKYLWLDGATGNTGLVESGAGVLDAYSGGTKYLSITHASTKVEVLASDLEIDAGQKFYLDGGTNNYLTQSGSVLDAYVGGTNYLKITHGSTKVEVLNADLEIDTTQKFYLDGGGNTYIYASVTDEIYIIAGGVQEIYMNQNTGKIDMLYADLSLATTKKLYLDGGSDSYLTESANVIDIYAGGANYLKISHSGTKVEVLSANLEIDATKRFYLDGGGDTYISEGVADSIYLTTGGTTRVVVENTLMSLDGTIDFSVSTTKKLYLDGGVDTYIIETAPGDILDTYVGGTLTSRSTATGMWGLPPVGSIVAFCPAHFDSNANTNPAVVGPAGDTEGQIKTWLASNASSWWLCDGTEPNDSDSPIWSVAGRHVPELGDDRFTMGATTIDAGGGVATGGSSTVDIAHAHAFTQPTAHGITQPTFTGPSHTHGAGSYQFQVAYWNDAANELYFYDLAGNYEVGIGREDTSTDSGGFAINYDSMGSSTEWMYTQAGTGSSGAEGTGACTRSGDVGLSNNHSGGSVTNLGVTNLENRPKYLRTYYIVRIK